MATFIIEVEFMDLDQDTTSDFYGPYRSREAAEKDRDRLREHLERLPQSILGERFVKAFVWHLDPMRIRPIVAGARQFIADGEPEEED